MSRVKSDTEGKLCTRVYSKLLSRIIVWKVIFFIFTKLKKYVYHSQIKGAVSSVRL